MSPTKVLVVEDEGITALTLCDLLEDLGYEVLGVAVSGQEAVAKVKAENPDLVLMDVMLEGEIDGIDAAELIAEHHDTPIVFLTAHSDHTTVARARNVQPYGYLAKPIKRRELYATVEVALERAKLVRQIAASKETISAILASIADSVIVCDESGEIRYLNQAASTLLGAADNLIEGRPLGEILRLSERGRPIVAELSGAIGDDSPSRSWHELQLDTLDGRVLKVDLSVARLELLGNRQGHGLVFSFRDATERIARQQQQALQRSEEHFRSLIEKGTDVIMVLDREGLIRYVSPSVERSLGHQQAELLAKSVFSLVIESMAPELRRILGLLIEGNGPSRFFETRLKALDGGERFFEVVAVNRLDDDAITGLIFNLRDITERRAAEARLDLERDRFRQLFEGSPQGIVVVGLDDVILDVNQGFADLFGHSREEARGSTVDELIIPPGYENQAASLSELVGSGRGVHEETRRLRKNGEVIDVDVIGYPVFHRSRQIGVHAIYSDISQRKQAEEQLVHDAYHDGLTGLSNRALLLSRLEQVVELPWEDEEPRFAVLLLDLDQFKVVNDSLGHDLGDQMLIAVSRRLDRLIGGSDTIARLGGDEFGILIESAKNVHDVMRLSESIASIVAEPIDLAGHEVVSSASIGIAFDNGDYCSATEVMRDADTAVNRAKAEGRGQHVVFDRQMHQMAQERMRLEADLRRAITGGQLRVVYQPITALETGDWIGCEALVRWAHPQRGEIAPGNFIPIAEETGQIVELDRLVLRIACQQTADWNRQLAPRQLKLNVNFSSLQFSTPDLVDCVRQCLEDTGLDASMLRLELTESLLMSWDIGLEEVLLGLADLGVEIQIDDFGTGYSSLSYLTEVPADTLKIDRSFITRMSADERGEVIVRTIIAMAKQLGMSVVAEGIETDDQLQRLRQLGCDFGQGYYFARPMPPEEVLELLRSKTAS